MQDKNVIKLTDQDAALLEQGASMLEGLENDERNRGNCSTAEGAGCSAHAVRRLASALLAHEREIGQCLHQITEPQAAPAAVAVPDEQVGTARQFLDWMYARRGYFIPSLEGDLQEFTAQIPAAPAADEHATQLATLPAAAAPVVLPESEAVISEVMELVKDWAQRDLIAIEAGIDTLTEESSDKQHQEAKRLDGEAEKAYRAIETKLRALLATATGLPAQTVLPEWDKVRRGLTMLMLGFSGRPDCTESAAEAALDAATESGMPLAALRMLAGVSTPAARPEQDAHDNAMDWDQLPEDSSERARFNRNLDLLYGGDPRVSIATALSLWATPANGGLGLMCAIFANEVAKLHLAPQAREDSALLDAMERQRIAVLPEYEGPWDAEVYNGDEKPNHRGSGSTPREAIRAAIAAAEGE